MESTTPARKTPAPWSCARCTYENDAQSSSCEMCMSARESTGSACSPAVTVAETASPNFRTPKKARAQPSVAPDKVQSLLVAVGRSKEKEEARMRKKVAQMRELGIDLSPAAMSALLARNCFSVHAAACEHFERMAAAEGGAAQGTEHDQRLARVVQHLETTFVTAPDFRLLGRTPVTAAMNRSGVKLCMGEQLLLQAENAGKKRLRPGTSATSTGFVRVSNMQRAQIGRLEREFELLFHPLMKAGLLRLGGVCEAPPTSSQMFASFDVGVFVYVNVKAFDVFTEGHAQFHLSEPLYAILQLLHMPNGTTASAFASTSTSVSVPVPLLPAAEAKVKAEATSEVNPEDLDTLFSECVGANNVHNASNAGEIDPAAQLMPYLDGIELRAHQKQALRWMLWRENQLQDDEATRTDVDCPLWEERHFRSQGSYFVNPFEKSACLTRPEPPSPCLGGILADDMGMGKTMMMLALIAHQKHFKGDLADAKSGSPTQSKRSVTHKTLVICPLSLLHQWKNEAQERFLPRALKVHVYYGDDRDTTCAAAMESFNQSDVVLTTYGVLSKELEKARGELLLKTEWNRVILDEAHSIKNRSTNYFRACSSVKATHRWCLTGTPIQNTLDDLFSLLSFLQYQPWSRIAWWKRVILKPYENGEDVSALGRLKAILTPVLLRRTKHSRDQDGKKIVQLPPKHVDLVKLEFSADERAFYQALYDRSRAEFNGFVASGSAMSSYVAIFALLLRLRQACDHPLLALGKDFEQVARVNDKESKADAVKATRSAFQPQENESVESYYRRISEQLQQDMEASNRTQLLQDGDPSVKDQANAGGGTVGGLTRSYIQSVIAQVEDGLESQECPICLDPPQRAVLTPCAHVLCDECLRESLANDPESGCPVCRAVVDIKKVFMLPTPVTSKARGEDSDDGTETSPMGDETKQAANTNTNAQADADVPNDLETGDGTRFQSVKLRQLLCDLKAIRQENAKVELPAQKRKVVVFSQWASMLEMVSRLLRRHGFSHCVFNGAMSQEARERVLTRFSKEPDVEVLIISLKAGGVGLNLTCASVVILLDPWWNPGVEEQAVDRVHRLGQTQDVLVKRYVVSDTVEDMILQLQERKAKMARHVLVAARTQDERRGERLNLDDLKHFFRRGSLL